MFYSQILSPVLSSIKNFSSRNAFCIDEEFYTYEQFGQCISKVRKALSLAEYNNPKVGLVVNDDLETYASIFALWLEGDSYVPLHPNWPLERCLDICEQVELDLILDSSKETRYKDFKVIPTATLEYVQDSLVPKPNVSDDDLAYILFTSGSTGKPKGVQLSRKNLASFVQAFFEHYSINDGMYVRMIHITTTTKNYFDLNTASYPTYDAAIRDILNCFFVSGEKIINDMLENFGGKSDFEDFTSFSGTKYYSVDDSSIYISYDESNNNQIVEADDEINYYNIPTDTVYSYVYNQQEYFVNGRCSLLTADMTMSYQLNGENWQRKFSRNQIFDSEVKIEKVQNPKDNGYKLVDTMYDL